ncbi:MAG TPA: type VI secretion system tube protein TssD [Candidatus Saccharimonadales bacterium]|nr:type VI secretion system tube protein TssD [Candidatus Saccharimonadales bacterium]
MAQEPKLSVDGSPVPNLLEVSYNLRAGVDRDGRPTRLLMFDGINIRRISDANTVLMDWSRSPQENNRKAGEVEFFADSGKSMKKFTWKNGFVKHYDLHYNPQADHVEESITIQAEHIESAAVPVDFNWADK